MGTDRRAFLKLTAAAGGALGLGLTPERLAAASAAAEGASGSAASGRPTPPPRAIRLLILGGTGFIGPYQVRYAMARGHHVTLFNRGRTAPDMFPGVETLIGDRNGDLESLRGHTWDVVIDNSTSRPDWVELSAKFLRDSVGLYFYVSSRSAYADTSRVPMTADAPVHTYETAGVEPGAEQIPYGLAKALSERAAQAAFPGRTNIVRPGLIIGPGDDTDRFTYWPVRIHRGGEVLAPGDPTDPVQIIDVRDLTEWQVRMAENGTVGVFNGVGPRTPRPMAELLYGIRAVTTAETTFTWVSYEFLTEMGLRPYSHLPVWMPPTPGREGFARFDLTPEIEAGLTFRPLAVTAKDTLDFHFSRPAERQAQLRAGISAEREAEVLAAWHARG
ncbi:MAG TPA: NAD-dependent epimerase/dehydratase family protein [Longimicrobiales bacterium]|nr:NAD-dependent epimerase/dehydratase family protein [Longimicrobiales bacterium]